MSQCKRERVNVDGHVLFCQRDDGHVGLHVDVGGFAWGSELSERETVAAIVKWLRDRTGEPDCEWGKLCSCSWHQMQKGKDEAAEAIERGEWK